MTDAQRKDAIKFLALLMGNCHPGGGDHSWRKCPRCLAFEQMEQCDPLAMRLLAAAVEALNDATPRTKFTADDLRNGTIEED